MRSGSRELIVIALLVVSLGAYVRYGGNLKRVDGGKAEPSQPVVDENGDLIVWSAHNHAGQTWMHLGPNGKIDYPDNSGINGGKALTICMIGEGHRGCGLNWKGWYPEDSCDDASRYHSLVFHIRQTTSSPGADLSVSLVDNLKRGSGEAASNSICIVGDGLLPRIDSQWRKVVVPLSRFTQNRPLRLNRLWEINFTRMGMGDIVFQIDRIGFSDEKGVSQPTFPSQPVYRATARVEVDAPGHRISDGIYGVCNLPEERLRHFDIAVTRWGGNTTSRYNWKINADNGAADWYFRNRGTPIRDPSDTAYLKHFRTARAAGGTAYITVPMLGRVARDHESYGFSMKKYGPQKEVDPANADAGNGIRRDGTPINNSDPDDTSIAVGPDFVEEAVAFAVREAGRADGSGGKAGIKYWALDNEPMLWHKTHRDVRHEPLGYDELWERTVEYAEAIKKADPTAKVAGFCSWGWTDLFYSAKDEGGDNYATQADRRAHGGEPLAEWFIRKCGEYRKKHGKPLVDVFDFHWYPQSEVKGKTPYLGKGRDPALNELRLRSTRDLWHPDYRQESWIHGASGGQATKVIRRVRDWIDKHNPGMEICLGEYNFGGGDNITGALAQADTFGILAREKVDLAFIWTAPEGTQNLAWELFRNYDHRGGRFGESLLPAASDNTDLAVYAAKRRDGAITIVVINKNLGGVCDVTLNAPGLKGNLRTWRFDKTSENVWEVAGDGRTVEKSISLKAPPASASILVVK